MPRRADHEQRRTQIAGALLRVAARHGLHAVGLREVAAEAGVSLRLVQYYFDTKQQLLGFTLRYLAGRLDERIRDRIRATGTRPSPRVVIEAILTEALPADEESRIFHLVYESYAVLAMTDPTLTVQSQIANSGAMENIIASQLRSAQQAGHLVLGREPDAEAAGLLAMSAGLGTSVLLGQRTPDQAAAILRYHLDRLLPATAQNRVSPAPTTKTQ